MASQQEPLAPPSTLETKKSTRSLISTSVNALPVAFLGSDATTAVTLASSDQAELSIFEDGAIDKGRHLERSSPLSSPQPSMVLLLFQTDTEPSPFVEHLHDFVNSSMVAAESTMVLGREFNVLTETLDTITEQYLEEHVYASTLGSRFTSKLKHLFILSSAGKPIYSMNGDDSSMLGYSGLLTTLLASFEEGTNTAFKSLAQDGFRMVVMNKAPLVFVAISKVSYELMLSDKILQEQLSILYSYVLAVLSRPIITKSFHNRMNYDLRRMLSAQDFRTLHALSTRLTYGYRNRDSEGIDFVTDPSLYLATLLDNSLQCAHLSNTVRMKLNDILLACKHLRVSQPATEQIPLLQGKLYPAEATRHVAADLLFAFVVFDGKVVSYLRPKVHALSNLDISTLILVVGLTNDNEIQAAERRDLWIPVCLADFNEAGFLHCYVRYFFFNQLTQPLTLLLLSGNKNSFFDMKQCSNYILAKINSSKTILTFLPQELTQVRQPLTLSLKVPKVEHFIYKRRQWNQFYMDSFNFKHGATKDVAAAMLYMYLYTALYSSKAEEVKLGADSKKLTYTRWHVHKGYTGFLLSDENYEFYCICNGLMSSLVLIKQSLRIINWFDRNRRRLFVGEGVQF